MSYFNRDDPVNKSENFKIREIPHLVAPLKISQLNFSHNQIRSIPPHIKAAANLHILDLSHNKISKIQHIFHITTLKFINLSHNLISELPSEIINLIQIENVDLSFNKIKIMSSIKVLKSLFELRMLEYKGFLQINLEGNEVLKKKGCRELYSKWKSPSDQGFDSLRKMNNQSISRTKKRNAKSVELPFRQKESELIQTNRTLLMPPNSKLITSFNLADGTSFMRSNELASKPQQMTEKLKFAPYSSQSEQLKTNTELNTLNSKELNSNEQISRLFNFKDLSVLQQENMDNNNVKQWFNSCVQQLNNLVHMFRLIVDNEDFNNIQPKIKEKMAEESRLAQQLINLTLQAISSELNADFQRPKQMEYRERVELLFQKIRILHRQIINLLNEKQTHSIKLYKPWVLHYRKLKSLIASTTSKIHAHKQNILREKQIQQLVNISPEKTENVISQPKEQNVKSSAKRKQIDKLNQLLFSKTNDEYLLLSEGKRSNSEKKTLKPQKENVECDNCLMSKWETNKCKQEINELKDQVRMLSVEKQKLTKKIKQLQTFKDKYLSLQAKQNLIIEQLEVIQPSTYQNLMLEQAKTIEYMLSIEPMVQTDDITHFNRFKSKEIAPTSICTEKHLTGMNTRLSSNKQQKISTHDWKNKVSEFTIQPKNEKSTENEGRSSSYFKKKNVITTVNKTQKQSNQSNGNHQASINKYQVEERDRHKVVVSQFNSEVNSMPSSEKKQEKDQRQHLISNHSRKAEALNNYENVAHKQSVHSKKQKTQSDIILISDNSESKQSASLKYSKKSSKIQDQSLSKYQHVQNLISKKLSTSQPKNNPTQGSQDNKENDRLMVNRFGGKIDLKNNNGSTNKNKTHYLTHTSKLAQKHMEMQFFQANKYKGHVYQPMQCIEAENYKKYMQYHLRNNIIQILSKKGNLMPQNYQKKYLYLTKSQKLINKKAQTSRQSQKSTSRQKSNRVVGNTTLR